MTVKHYLKRNPNQIEGPSYRNMLSIIPLQAKYKASLPLSSRTVPNTPQAATGDFCTSEEDCEIFIDILKYISRAARRRKSKELFMSKRLLEQMSSSFNFPLL